MDFGQAETIVEDLIATGKFASVEREGLNYWPTLAPNYDATYVFYSSYDQSIPDTPQHETVVIRGDLFQRYIERGGAIVMTQGTMTEVWGPGGTFRTDMMPMTNSSSYRYGSSDIDSIPFPGEHELFAGIRSLSLGRYTQTASGDIVVHPSATVHATWPNGEPMVVSMGSIVSVNVWGVSTDAIDQQRSGYPADSDMTLLIANSLVYAAGHNPATACNGDYDDDGLSDEDEVTAGTDFQNPDSDADGLLDGTDTCPLFADPDNTDLDGDGLGDPCDDDWDSDGVLNDPDNCPRVANPSQDDADNDGQGDACGDDWDADGTLNDVDNCPRTANPDQEDRDNDGVGDACEPDDGRTCGVMPGSAPVGLGLIAAALLMARRRRGRSR